MIDRPERWLNLIHEHQARYPAMTVQDIYKLLYQGILGPEHMFKNKDEFSGLLNLEMKQIQPDSQQLLFEPVQPIESIDSQETHLYRLHLRAWLAAGKSNEELVSLCMNAVNYPWGTQFDLRELWGIYCDSLAPDTRRDADDFSIFLVEKKYPPVHHSGQFRTAYSPAYRLICK